MRWCTGVLITHPNNITNNNNIVALQDLKHLSPVPLLAPTWTCSWHDHVNLSHSPLPYTATGASLDCMLLSYSREGARNQN
jgi:hypothetical protein